MVYPLEYICMVYPRINHTYTIHTPYIWKTSTYVWYIPYIYHTYTKNRVPDDTGQRAACPEHHDGVALCSNATLLHAASLAIPPIHALHIPGPSQSPQVDEPHPATVAGAWPWPVAVAGCASKHVAQVVQNGPGVSNGNYRKFS